MCVYTGNINICYTRTHNWYLYRYKCALAVKFNAVKMFAGVNARGNCRAENTLSHTKLNRTCVLFLCDGYKLFALLYFPTGVRFVSNDRDSDFFITNL